MLSITMCYVAQLLLFSLSLELSSVILASLKVPYLNTPIAVSLPLLIHFMASWKKSCYSMNNVDTKYMSNRNTQEML